MDTPFRQTSITVTRTRHHSFHSSSTSRPFIQDIGNSPPICYHFQAAINDHISNTSSQHVKSPRSRRYSHSTDHRKSSVRKSLDEDLDQLATQLLEQLDSVDEFDDDTTREDITSPTLPLSPKPDSYVRRRPRSVSTEVSASDDIKGLASKMSGPFTIHNIGMNDVPLISKARSSKNRQSGSSTARSTAVRPTSDTIYANIIDLPQGCQPDHTKQAGSKSGLVRMLRRAKAFGDIRLIKNHLVVQKSDSEERLGLLLSPPPGSSHFDVQLVLCGLLRRNAASPYELYNFFLENGFFAHLALAPEYEGWAAGYTTAIQGENPFYQEGIRVGLEGDMDFLRTIFQTWCDAWHDWRMSRPIP